MLSTEINFKQAVDTYLFGAEAKRKENVSNLLRAIDCLNDLIRYHELLKMALEECKTDNRVSLLLEAYLANSETNLEEISCSLEKMRKQLPK